MEKKPRTKLTLRSRPPAKERPITTLEAAKAYVAPEPTAEELEAMPPGQWLNYTVGANVNEHEWVSDGVVTFANEWNDYWEESDYDFDDEGPIDDQATAAYIKDWQRSVAHDPGVPHGVEIGGQESAKKELVISVALAVSRWAKPPKAEATAAGIGLAVTQIRGERGVKHPRDIAKEVKVRAQTLHQIKNVALEEIQRLNLAAALRDTDLEDAGTYNQSEGEEESDEDRPFLLP